VLTATTPYSPTDLKTHHDTKSLVETKRKVAVVAATGSAWMLGDDGIEA
jgi:hypothetical protein